jgi:hypothetical protein
MSLPIRAEQHRTGEAGLENAVAELPEQPDAEQAAKSRLRQRCDEVSSAWHAPTLVTVGGHAPR